MKSRQYRRVVDSAGVQSLILDELDLDPAVARRLSPTLASRHHALPVVAVNRRLTVAMADPTDIAAREAIAGDLRVEPCIVQGDRTAIDRLVMVKLYVGLLVLIIGLSNKNHRREAPPFSWRRIAGLGMLAAFDRGISGGGYGPVVTGGQVLCGIRGRSAIGIASFAGGIASVSGVAVCLCSGASITWYLAPSLLLGAVLSVPISAYLVSRLPIGRLILLISSLSTGLGVYTVLRVVIAAI